MKSRLPTVRRRETPQPSEPGACVMDALAALRPGEQVCLTSESEPFSLYRILSNNAYAYCASLIDDGRYEIRIWQCGARHAASGMRP